MNTSYRIKSQMKEEIPIKHGTRISEGQPCCYLPSRVLPSAQEGLLVVLLAKEVWLVGTRK